VADRERIDMNTVSTDKRYITVPSTAPNGPGVLDTYTMRLMPITTDKAAAEALAEIAGGAADCYGWQSLVIDRAARDAS
jgi:hypothetical protein